MAFVTQVEAAQAVPSQGVSPTLQHDCSRPVPIHDMANDLPHPEKIHLDISSEKKVGCLNF